MTKTYRRRAQALDLTTSCLRQPDVNWRSFDFKSGIVTIGLPNFMQTYFNDIESSTVCGNASSISLFPNPTSDAVTIGFPSGCDQNFNVAFQFAGSEDIFYKGKRREFESVCRWRFIIARF